MKFKEWLSISEASKGRQRAKTADISNVSIGKIGPYGTFGQDDAPGITKTAVGHLVGGFSSSLKDELGPVDTFPHLVGDLFKGKSAFGVYVDYPLPLQLPTVNGQEMVQPVSYSDEANIRKIRALISDPLKDPRVRKDFKELPSGFDLYNEENANRYPENSKMSPMEAAKRFTIGLCAIIISNKIKTQKNYISIQNKYEIDYPTFDKSQIKEVEGGYYYIHCQFICKKKKSYFGDEDDKTDLKMGEEK